MSGKKQPNGVGRMKVLEAHRANPRASLDDLVEATGLSRTTCHYHLCQLDKEGVITRNKQVGRIAGYSPVRRADRNDRKQNGLINRVTRRVLPAQYYIYNCKECGEPIMSEEERVRGTCAACLAKPAAPRVFVQTTKPVKKSDQEKRIDRIVARAKAAEKQQSHDVFFHAVRSSVGPIRGGKVG